MTHVELESRISDAEANYRSLRKLMFDELRHVRDDLKHLREMMGHINLTLDLVLKALHADEKQDEVENG